MSTYTLAQLAEHLNGVLYGEGMHSVHGLASLTQANNLQLAYYDGNPVLLEFLQTTQAAAVLLKSPFVSYCPVSSIVVADPFQSMSELLNLFDLAIKQPEGIHPKAQIAETVHLGANVSIAANSQLGNQVRLAEGVSIAENCQVADGVYIGSNTRVEAGVVLQEGTKIGADCIIGCGTVIGATPFNAIKMKGRWERGHSIGGVVVADSVSIGANSVITRGSISDTIIAEGVCIDNLVHIAHDVIIGANTAIAGCAAVGAFAKIGMDCIIGGASCIAAYVTLANDIVITGMSTVSKSLNKSGLYSSGTMVSEHNRWRRNVARFRRLDDYIQRLMRLEQKN